jgi:hypothetical protein
MEVIVFLVTYVVGLYFWHWSLDERAEKWDRERLRRKGERNKERKIEFHGIGCGVGACTRYEYEAKMKKAAIEGGASYGSEKESETDARRKA